MVVQQAEEIVADPARPAEPTMEEPTSKQMLAMLALLPPQQQEVLRLRVVEGISSGEVATRLNVKVAAVRGVQHRALITLRHLIEDHAARYREAADVDSSRMWEEFQQMEIAVEPTMETAVGSRAQRQLPLAQQRTEFVIAAVGSAANLAKLLNVSRSQPTRWRNGEEIPSPGVARALIDLDHVMARALLLFPQPVALDWLNSANSFLDGARPIDVLQTRGSTEVIQALDAVMAGAFS